jgi:hypothetical protein
MTIERRRFQVDTISEAVNRHRRRFLGAAAATVAATQVGMMGSAAADIPQIGSPSTCVS